MFQLQLCCFEEDLVGIIKIIKAFVKLSEADPDKLKLPKRFLGFNSRNRVLICFQHKLMVILAEFNPVEPSVHIVRVLLKNSV